MAAYYNEFDPFAAAWLRELIAAGLIAPGEVDERDIRDVRPDELAGFTQCHFFAGIGVWSYALRQAGWPDDRAIWTMSCPCQPFSAAGSRAGFADERHLWPSAYHLIEQCEPVVIAGEQVAASNVDAWFDLVQSDLEGMGYSFGLCPFPSASVGAPHIRDRAFWLADSGGFKRASRRDDRPCDWAQQLAGFRAFGWVGNPNDTRFSVGSWPAIGRRTIRIEGQAAPSPGPLNGFWSDAQWVWCSDDRWRPTEPGVAALAHGAPARVGRLRGYGNAINAEAAKVFIEAVMDHLDGLPVTEAA